MHDHSPQNCIFFWVLQNITIYLPGCARQNARSLSGHLFLYLFDPHTQSVTRFCWVSFLNSSGILPWPQGYHPSPSHHSRSLSQTMAVVPWLVSSKAISTLKPELPEGLVHNADVNMSPPAWKCSRARLKEACRPCLCEGFRPPSHVRLSLRQVTWIRYVPSHHRVFARVLSSVWNAVPSLICLINSYSSFIFHLISLREAFSDLPDLVKSPIM